MNCLIKEDGTSNISIDKKKIIELRSLIIKKYARLVPHYKPRFEMSPQEVYRLRSDPLYRNMNSFYNSYSHNDYFYCYEDYVYPEIVNLINEILRGDLKAVKKLHTINLLNKDKTMGVYYKELESYVNVNGNNQNINNENVPSKNNLKSLFRKILKRK